MSETCYIRAGQLIDGRAASENQARAVPRDRLLLIRDGWIEEIGDAESIKPPEGANVLDWSGYTVTPGLIDMRVQLTWSPDRGNPPADVAGDGASDVERRVRKHASELLACGITTVRDLGGAGDVVSPLRDSISAGDVPGPRIIVGGKPITTPGGHLCAVGDVVANDAEAMERAVREQARGGVDWICVIACGGFTPGTDPRAMQYGAAPLMAAARAAREGGLRITAHCHPAEGIEWLLDAGYDCIEQPMWYGKDRGTYDYRPRVCERMEDEGTYAVIALEGDRREVLESDFPGPHPERLLRHYQHMEAFGVRMIPASNAGAADTNFGDFAYGLELFHRFYGPPRGEALECATRVAAYALGLEGELGTLEPGRRADLLAFDGNPHDDLTVLRRPCCVMKDGRLVSGADVA